MTDLEASQARQDKMDPAGAGKRAESRAQLAALQAARASAGWSTSIEGLALDVAIYVHLGGGKSLALTMRFLHERLQADGRARQEKIARNKRIAASLGID